MDNKEELQREYAELLTKKLKQLQYNKVTTFFPAEGPNRRELYPKHVTYMEMGNKYHQRAFIAGNRIGKTLTGAFEAYMHLTQDYPEWWSGYRFDGPILMWAASVSNEKTRDVLQKAFCGPQSDLGSGMIPKDTWDRCRAVKKPGVADAYEVIHVPCKNGGMSELRFKSYEQGRESFQGDKVDFIWLDEEPKLSDQNIYVECLMRTASGGGERGLISCTFTPLFGISDIVKGFLPDGLMPSGGINGNKYVTQVSWEDVPHLTEAEKEDFLKEIPPHLRMARIKGIPFLGAGAIFPFDQGTYTVPPFEIPVYWPKAYGFDLGWRSGAAVWGARDPSTNILYIYSEHFQVEVAPAIHASAVKQRGDWLIGAVDPKTSSEALKDSGKTLIEMYEREGLSLVLANNAVDPGIFSLYQAFASGMIKIFSTCNYLLSELRTYHRDENGKLVKRDDHAIDALRYLWMTGMDYAETMPDPDKVEYHNESIKNPYGWN